ncbi:MAG: ferredoxin:thioredoxin reductase [Desulfamplus sp.]|nr:ferredoxin:thioredoxin reductase [Desulfamplus sp.]
MNAETLYENLRKIQEPKGYFFNRDKDLVLELLDSLINNKERYGYMACPCRLASGDREWDRDINCPCEYRDADMDEFGSCFCGLYVSSELNEGKREACYVPERRPVEKIL